MSRLNPLILLTTLNNTCSPPPQGYTVMFDGCPMVLDIDTLADLARVFTAQDALNTGDVNMCTALLTVHDHHRVRVSLGQRSERGGLTARLVLCRRV